MVTPTELLAIQGILKVDQLELITEQFKNEKLDAYYRMREQDRVL